MPYRQNCKFRQKGAALSKDTDKDEKKVYSRAQFRVKKLVSAKGVYTMKRTTLFIFVVMMLVITISCGGNKDTKHIISVKKASSEKLISAFEKFENNFMLRSDLFDHGSAKAELFLTDYDLQGPVAQAILQNATIVDRIIQNKIGMTGLWVNDKKEKAFKYSYAFNNILTNEPKTDVLTLVIGQKNIEAASPSIFNKKFSIPAQDLGKALTLIAPKEFPANLTIDLTYNTLRALSSIRPDKASQKRYDKAQDILYKNAVITRNGDTYSIVFNNDDVVKFIPALTDALKNDNRLKWLWVFYEKILDKELKELEEKFNTETKDKIKDCTFTETLSITNSLVAQDQYTLAVSGTELVTFSCGIKNYENPIDGMTYSFSIADPETPAVARVSCVFASEGSVTDTTADIDCSLVVSFTDNPDTPLLPVFDMHGAFYADTTKQDDNFQIGMDMSIAPTRNEDVDISMQVVGSVTKTSDMITYKIDTINIEMDEAEKGANTLKLETDASVIFSKNILEDIVMPKETVNVLETKVNEWQTIKEEVTANLDALSTHLNL